ncbi:MAG TPA: DUF5127 domain-containing protein [Actinospica sp.]|jgi:hypothetical protein|nr:DUF5127 domain-containing protein [Actinospica sp.]
MHPSSSGDPATPGDDGGRPNPFARRDLLRLAGAAALAAVAVPLLPEAAQASTVRHWPSSDRSIPKPMLKGGPSSPIGNDYKHLLRAQASTFTPVRPPATPLLVRSPYLSCWQGADDLAGTWSSFWNGHITAMCGIARIDGTPYLFAGAPALPGGPTLTVLNQTSLQVTATQSTYSFNGGGVELTVTFLSPVDPDDLKRQCVPFGYVTMQAASTDGAAHAVEVYFDISGEWAHGDTAQNLGWSQTTTSSTVALTNTPTSPSVLAEFNDQASWGTVVIASPNAANLTWQIGQDTVVRAQAASTGALANTQDANQPRPISEDWPVFAFCAGLGTVTPAAPSAPFQVVIGHVRTPAVSFLGTDLAPWWTTYWSTWQKMVDWFVADYRSALRSASALDRRIQQDAEAAAGGGTAGSEYAAICALALRQAFGGTELVVRDGAPWAFLKEISSDGNVSTVDVLYPASPAYLYLSPSYFKLLLEPLLYYAENGWIEQFAEHDLGAGYPNAAGGVSNGVDTQEDMPVEETGNMLIMSAALMQRIPEAQAAAFARQHYAVFRQWAEYLLPNALDPGYQNQTDDFTGKIANSVNLAAKGIIGIGAMSLVAGFAKNAADRASYLDTAFSYISQWTSLGEDPSNPSLDLAYADPGTWSLKYNCFPDRLLGLDLVPLGIQAQEAAWYQSQAGDYGVLLDPRNDYTKADWELWTAAWLADQTSARNTLISGVYGYLQNTGSRVPFSDLYVVSSAAQVAFQNRPVVGGVFGLLLRPAKSATTWYKIRNNRSGLLLGVFDVSLAESADVIQSRDGGSADHLWAPLPNGDGTVRIANRNSGKVLAVEDASTADGADVQQHQDDGTAGHDWTLRRAGGNHYKIVNLNSGKVLAVTGRSTADGAQITQWDDNGAPDHLWTLLAQ